MGKHPRVSTTDALSQRWRRLALEIPRRKKPGEYEHVGPTDFRPLQIYFGGGTPKRLYYFTKDERCLDWKVEKCFPKGMRAITRYGVPTDEIIDTIRKLVADTGLDLWFVGDLDPHDLTVFAVLRNGNAYLEGKPRDALPVRYLGIDDRWIGICEKYLENGQPIESMTMPMRLLERELYELVREMLPDLPQLVGPRAFALLEAGMTLDFIGATNPAFYDEPFWDVITAHILRARPRMYRVPARR